MPKKSRKMKQAEKATDPQKGGYSLTMGSGLMELQNYDPVAASFLRRTICCGDYEFTLSAVLRSEVSLEEFAPVAASGAKTNGLDVAIVGRRLADVLWEALCVSTNGWNRDPKDSSSVKYYRASRRASDEVDHFVAGYSFLPCPDMGADDIWSCMREVAELYETTRSAMGGDNDAAPRKTPEVAEKKPEMAGELDDHFARMSGELATLAENLGPTPGFLLAEYLFPGSSKNIEICSQYVSDGNWKSLICATETHVYSLDFATS